MKTWRYELAVVAIVLGAVVALTGGGWVEVIGAAAVLAGFAHAQVADRMAEKQAAKAKPDVGCYRSAQTYFLAKEVLWLAYFVAHRSYSALFGVVVFLLYPLWRRWWRARHPIAREPASASWTHFPVLLFLSARRLIVERLLALDIGDGRSWSGRFVLRLDRSACEFVADRSRQRESLGVQVVDTTGQVWSGSAKPSRLQFFDDPKQPGVRFAVFEVVGEGRLELAY